MMKTTRCLLTLLLSVSLSVASFGAQIQISVENLAGPTGTALSPFFIGFHDGSFDPFNAGNSASTGVESLAELGDPAGLLSDFANDVPTGVSIALMASSDAYGPGIYLPGGAGSITLGLDPVSHRYVTYASMVVPSNDYFIANDSAFSIQLFDVAGNFTGANLVVMGNQILNAGTETDNPTSGPAFVVGQDPTAGAAEGSVISVNDNLALFNGVATEAGYVFSEIPAADTPIARIAFRLVPEPTGAVLALAAIVGMLFGLKGVGRNP
jgi:hypothetical protein